MENMQPDEDGKLIPEWQYKADEIFEAFLNCVRRNLPEQVDREEGHRYLLHKYVWHITGDNDTANVVLRLICEPPQ